MLTVGFFLFFVASWSCSSLFGLRSLALWLHVGRPQEDVAFKQKQKEEAKKLKEAAAAAGSKGKGKKK